jgi:hypothetical protein
MNERIQELAEQAGMRECSLGYGMPENVLRGENQIENFAELIVTECLDLLWNSLSISEDHDGTVDGIAYTGKEILTAAKEHFGVEK